MHIDFGRLSGLAGGLFLPSLKDKEQRSEGQTGQPLALNGGRDVVFSKISECLRDVRRDGTGHGFACRRAGGGS